MKEFPQFIILMRHGVAVEQDEWDGADDLRPLTNSGRKKATEAASGLLEEYQPSIVFSSGLVRAEQTADCIDEAHLQAGLKKPVRRIAASLNHSSDFGSWKRFLEGGVRSFASLRMTTDAAGNTIMAVGHEPSISHILAGHLGIKSPVFSFKKAGIAVLRPTDSLERCELIAFVPPRFLRGMRT